MLSKILLEFDRERRPLSSHELAGILGKDLGVVEGMLETLVRTGRLAELGSDGSCDQCPEQNLCVVLPFEDRRFCRIHIEVGNASGEHGRFWEERE